MCSALVRCCCFYGAEDCQLLPTTSRRFNCNTKMNQAKNICMLIVNLKNRYSAFEYRYSIGKKNIAIYRYNDIFSHPYLRQFMIQRQHTHCFFKTKLIKQISDLICGFSCDVSHSVRPLATEDRTDGWPFQPSCALLPHMFLWGWESASTCHSCVSLCTEG